MSETLDEELKINTLGFEDGEEVPAQQYVFVDLMSCRKKVVLTVGYIFVGVACFFIGVAITRQVTGNGKGQDECARRMAAGVATPGCAFKGNWRKMPFSAFSAQCSHNTFQLGQQSGTFNIGQTNGVSSSAYKTALDLGYRCLEIDVWCRNSKGQNNSVGCLPRITSMRKDAEKQAGRKSSLKICHGMHTPAGSRQVSNSVDIIDVLDVIAIWMCQDEQKHTDKFPLILSIQNLLKDGADETFLGNALKERFAGRIVTTTEVKRGNGEEVLMGDLVSSQRKIILKAGLKFSNTWADMIAMPKYKAASDQTLGCQSLEANEKPQPQIQNDHLYKIFPSKFASKSQNYNPMKYLQAGMQMVCLNIQGTCEINEVCENPHRGHYPHKEQTDCPCKREFSAPLEKFFMEHGYDGYIIPLEVKAPLGNLVWDNKF